MAKGLGAIYVSGLEGKISLLPGEPYSDEAALQQLIAEHPSFGGDQIDEDNERRWLLTLQLLLSFCAISVFGLHVLGAGRRAKLPGNRWARGPLVVDCSTRKCAL